MSRPAFCALFFIVPVLFPAQNFDSACAQQRLVTALLWQHHYDPPDFTPETNREILELFIRNADEKNLFYMQRDVDALSTLAGEISGPDFFCAAISLSYLVFSERFHTLDSVTRLLGSRPLELDGKDTLNFVYRKKERVYCRSVAELSERMEKRVKFDVLRALTRQETTASSEGFTPDQVSRATQRSVNKLKQVYTDYRNPGALVQHLGDCMSDAIARRCDPHSNYLNAQGFGNYRTALSTQEKSFGFTAEENREGDLVISAIQPGGPAWHSDQVQERDVITTVRFGTQDVLSAADLSASELNDRLLESVAEEVELSVIGKNQIHRKVKLQRAVIHSSENMITGYLVSHKGHRMGFIPIPSFYLDPDRENRGCANDVAREIIRLREDSIEGVILDLRFNGGGSMREAISLAGIFIDHGPVAVYRQRLDSPFLVKDVSRGTVWDGPLVVLVNSASASASEFVAAALQDYNRAIVAGTESFGKGTAQNLIPVDTTDPGQVYSGKPGSVLKVTAGKFYRLTSRSLQGEGIKPDIPIPGIMDKVIDRESAHPYHLPGDSVQKTVTFEPSPPLPRAELLSRSRQRLSGSRFSEISALGDSLRSSAAGVEHVPLSLEGFRAYSLRHKRVNRRMEHLFTAPDPAISIRHNTSGSDLLSISAYLRRLNEKTVTALGTDIVFHESVKVMSDLIELSGKP